MPLRQAGGILGTPYCLAFEGLAFCRPIHNPPGASVITASALGYMPGDLNIFVVFAMRFGTGPRPELAGEVFRDVDGEGVEDGFVLPFPRPLARALAP